MAEHAAPERAVEHSLTGAKGNIAREHQSVDEHKATSFRPSKMAEAAAAARHIGDKPRGVLKEDKRT